MRSLSCMALLLAACIFDPNTKNAAQGVVPDADPAAPDADTTDADPTAPDADTTDAAPGTPDASPDPFCGWGYDPEHFDPCEDPPVSLAALSLATPNAGAITYVYNTTNGTLQDPQGGSVVHASTVLLGNRILWTSDFDLTSVANLRVVGSLPLVIASKSNVDIDGDISVASFFQGGLSAGAGSEPAACIGAGRGEDCSHGGAGGGGGAFSGAGGIGGDGAAGHNDCDNPDEFNDGSFESTGGAGGTSALTPAVLRGGCAGEEGGEGNGLNTFGEGAPGGGAIHLTAATTLTVTGRINAGGGGGRGATGSRAAGGGGGSGGMIGIEALNIELVAGGVLAANGGGGGGGGNNNGGQDGEDAAINGAQAQGGAPEAGQGTAGGDGGWLGDVDGGSPVLTANRGGGGGGGGAGYILYYQDTTPTLTSTLSPAAIVAP